MTIQPPLQRLLALLADPAAAQRFVPQPPAAILAHCNTLRDQVAALAVTDLPDEQVAALTGAQPAATPDLLAEISDLVTDIPAAARALELQRANVEGLLSLLFTLSSLERAYSTVYEGADNALLLCASSAADDLDTIQAAAAAALGDRSQLGPADRMLVQNRLSELSQMLRIYAAASQEPAPSTEVAALRDEETERAARDHFLTAIGDGQATHKPAPRAPLGAAR